MSNLIVLFLSCMSYAQQPIVNLEISPKEAEVGQSITITVKANVQGKLEVDLPKAFESGNSTMSSMQQEIDYSTGKVVTYMLHSQNGSFIHSGFYTIGPAYVRRGNKVFKSNVARITIKKEEAPTRTEQHYSNRQLTQPAFGVIQASKRSVYEGEPIVLTAKIFSRFPPTHLEGYEPYQAKESVEKHDLDEGSEEITLKEERIGRNDYYVFGYDKQLLFPLNSGKIKVSPFKLLLMRGFESFSLTSSDVTVDIKPLPKGAPNNFTGGVGSFNIVQKISSNNVKEGEMITLTRTIFGKGNIHLLSFPELILPSELELYGDPEVKETFSFGSEGAKGKVTYIYHVKAKGRGTVALPEFSLSYFDPEIERYVERTVAGEKLKIVSDPYMQTAGKSVVDNESFHKASKTLSAEKENSFLPNWVWIMLTALFALLSIKLFKDRKSPEISDNQNETEIHQSATNEVQHEVKTSPQSYLKNALEALEKDDIESFYTHSEKAVIAALGQITKDSSMKRAELLSRLQNNPRYSEITKWFSDFDSSRYGMGISGIEPKELLSRAEELIAEIH